MESGVRFREKGIKSEVGFGEKGIESEVRGGRKGNGIGTPEKYRDQSKFFKCENNTPDSGRK